MREGVAAVDLGGQRGDLGGGEGGHLIPQHLGRLAETEIHVCYESPHWPFLTLRTFLGNDHTFF